MRYLSIFSVLLIFVIATSFTRSGKLTISSPAFSDGGMIPKKYSCQGGESSPALQIGNVPKGAKSLALIVHDPDAPMPGGFTHWVMWNMDLDGNVPENFKGAEQGLNGAKSNGYKGMCPPTGTHHYHFYVYALDSRLNLDKSTDKAGLEKAMHGHILAEGHLLGLYKKD